MIRPKQLVSVALEVTCLALVRSLHGTGERTIRGARQAARYHDEASS